MTVLPPPPLGVILSHHLDHAHIRLPATLGKLSLWRVFLTVLLWSGALGAFPLFVIVNINTWLPAGSVPLPVSLAALAVPCLLVFGLALRLSTRLRIHHHAPYTELTLTDRVLRLHTPHVPEVFLARDEILSIQETASALVVQTGAGASIRLFEGRPPEQRRWLAQLLRLLARPDAAEGGGREAIPEALWALLRQRPPA